MCVSAKTEKWILCFEIEINVDASVFVFYYKLHFFFSVQRMLFRIFFQMLEYYTVLQNLNHMASFSGTGLPHTLGRGPKIQFFFAFLKFGHSFRIQCQIIKNFHRSPHNFFLTLIAGCLKLRVQMLLSVLDGFIMSDPKTPRYQFYYSLRRLLR